MLSKCLRPQFASKSSRLSQNGQGTLEYILLLVVTIAIVLMLADRLIKPFGTFVEGYMGSYLQCLLETGELPQMGADSGGGGECNNSYEPFSIAAGRPPKDGGSGGSGGGGGSNAGNEAGKNKGEGEGSGEGGGEDDGGGTGSQAGSGGGAGSGRMPSRGAMTESRISAGSSTSQGGGPEKVPVSESLMAGAGARGSNLNYDSGGNRRRDAYIGITGRIPAPIKKPEAKVPKKVAAPAEAKAQGSGDTRGSKIKVQPREVAQVREAEDEGFSLGKLIRMMFIALIIIAIVVFVGMQLLQISKSWES